jgi:hypothetical protein
MPAGNIVRPRSIIAVSQFRQLLIDLKTNRPDICIRYRLLGELWASNFTFVMRVTEKGLLLYDKTQPEKIIFISDISQVMQFELDAPFEGFEPYFHYDVDPFELLHNH